MLTYGRTAYTFTWKNGRQLATATANGKSLSFTYDDQGMRLTKTVDGVTHTYSLDGDRIVAEEWGNQLLVYFYDDDGLPMGMMYRNSSYADKQFDYYLYEKDVFDYILAIYNASGPGTMYIVQAVMEAGLGGIASAAGAKISLWNLAR